LRDLVLLPGFMCDQDLWTDMVPDLQKLGTLHYGNVYQDSTLDGMARRVLDSSPERFVLVGFSMGGFVARVLCLMAPERVTGVAFVASSARGYSEEETERRKKGYGPGGRPPRATSGAPGLHPDRENDPVLIARLRWGARCGRARRRWCGATATPTSSASPALPWSWPAARTGCAALPRASAWRGICRIQVSR
jgi:pimeloyl-ACP methyl ester carboxylesterase